MYPKNTLLAFEGVNESGNFLYVRDFVDNLTTNHDKYSHIIAVDGGYKSATFDLIGTDYYIRDWFDFGLMRKVIYFNVQGIPVFEGFVSKMSYSYGQDSITRSIDNHFNRIYMRYTPIDASNNESTSAIPLVIIVNDASFQRRFGVKAKVINGGEITDDEAYAWARAELRAHARIKTTPSINVSSSKQTSLKIEVKGFYETLDWIPYYSLSNETTQAHKFIQMVMLQAAEINPGFISTDFSLMDFNFLPVRVRSEDYKSCKKTIEDVIKLGGLAGERWVLGVYNDRQLVYKAAETITELYNTSGFLTRSIKDPKQKIYEEGLGIVEPWDMLPDRILRTTDR